MELARGKVLPWLGDENYPGKVVVIERVEWVEMFRSEVVFFTLKGDSGYEAFDALPINRFFNHIPPRLRLLVRYERPSIYAVAMQLLDRQRQSGHDSINGSCDRACKVCEAPCRGGEIEHGKGCRHMFEEGGGVETVYRER